jgi:hypothetical protein
MERKDKTYSVETNVILPTERPHRAVVDVHAFTYIHKHTHTHIYLIILLLLDLDAVHGAHELEILGKHLGRDMLGNLLLAVLPARTRRNAADLSMTVKKMNYTCRQRHIHQTSGNETSYWSSSTKSPHRLAMQPHCVSHHGHTR